MGTFELKGKTNFDLDNTDFSSYSVEGQFVDKRGDELRTQLNFVDRQVRQLETSAELKVVENVRIGYYSRYDDLNSKFIENRLGLRLKSSCKCWIFDVELSDKSNPDESKIAFNITLLGLGELGNYFPFL